MTYEYECRACWATTQIEAKIGQAEKEIICQACGDVAMLIISKPKRHNIILRGGGWAKDGYTGRG